MLSDPVSAFPLMPPVDETGRCAVGYPYPQSGMTLRDWYAGQALAGMGTWMPLYKPDGTPSGVIQDLCNPEMMRDRAIHAYAQADAMLAVRNAE